MVVDKNQILIGQRLKKKRKETGMTQEEVATYMNMKRGSTVSGWERGEKKLDNAKLTKLAKLYKVSPDYLLGHKEQEDAERSTYMQELLELSENDSWGKFVLVIDGERLTKGQTKRFIAFVRAERSIEND